MAYYIKELDAVRVEKGDTLSQITKDYGGGQSVQQIAAKNDIADPDLIYVDQVIYLSDSDDPNESTSSNKPEISAFGEQSNADNTLFATWKWGKGHTASYKVEWTYNTGDGVWFSGNSSTNTVDKDAPALAKQSTYSIPANAKQVRFRVKPISETTKKNNKDAYYWVADWSDVKTWTDSTPLTTPATPNVVVEKFKLTASLDNIDIPGATHIQFKVVKDNASSAFASKKAKIVSTHASHEFSITAGSKYKVCARAYDSNNDTYSEWSQYSNNEDTIPAVPSEITTIKATSETSVYLEWSAVTTAVTYNVEYATKKDAFDRSEETTKKNGIKFTHFEATGLESGKEHFFRVSATNSKGDSGWSEVKSVVIGTDPAAPTTWSSTTTAVVGEPLNLYWVHNSEDGSSQTYAEVELNVDGVIETYTVKNTEDEDEKDKTSVYAVDTTDYSEGATILWRVRTAGITNAYGDWSTQRTIDIYAPPTLELNMTDADRNPIETLTAFPFYIHALYGPNTQVPVGYHVSITANETYETTDNMGNPRTINTGDEVYSKYFDIDEELLLEIGAGNVDLENNIGYTITCRVSMNSGLTAEESVDFKVQWTDLVYEPNAEIGIDPDTMTASIRPYCVDGKLVCHYVTNESGVYTVGEVFTGGVWGQPVPGVRLETGELVYFGMTYAGKEIYYCYIEESAPVEDVLLSVYRREFDGSFVELATDLDAARATTITDPHPALDYARYRIVATSKTTGAVSYYDLPGYPVNGNAVIIQWDEDWTRFETSEADELVQPPWSGSLLKLPYNIDVSDSNDPDVSLIGYIGRSHPTSYYGTQKGQKATWNTEIPYDDEETLYALRRLAKWMGDVYVREPSGSGYWAHVVVSFSQTHLKLTIPVTLNITRVEGGV